MPAPEGIPELAVEQVAGITTLSWPAIPGATRYDATYGELFALLSTGGDFGAASLGCLEEDLPTLSFQHPEDPTAGDGFWYLVRGDNCGGPGTFDSGTSSQLRPRDPDLAAHPAACE